METDRCCRSRGWTGPGWVAPGPRHFRRTGTAVRRRVAQGRIVSDMVQSWPSSGKKCIAVRRQHNENGAEVKTVLRAVRSADTASALVASGRSATVVQESSRRQRGSSESMKFVAAGLLVSLLAPVALAGDWPCWRGPQLSGISQEKGWRDLWPKDGPPIAWRASVGVGFSAVSVAQGRLYTMGHKDGKDTVHCLDATSGKPIWSHSYQAALGDLNFEGGPTGTPTVHDGKVYTLSRWGDLYCFDAAGGKVHWSRNLVKEDNVKAPGWGFAGSPVILDKLLLLNVGNAGMALEKD